MASTTEVLLDAQGLHCPEPIMMLHQTIQATAYGQVIKMLATDPSTERDVKKFCQFLDHQLIRTEKHDDQYVFFIKCLTVKRDS
jgi:tRNA 2-thiouridine synthesizing protein A